ncbi:MAG TPA: hypothetical protein VHU18_15075 [Rhizomicrobium sp.]|nr:hypothetical protein [Rhizomicrobium sp.]
MPQRYWIAVLFCLPLAACVTRAPRISAPPPPAGNVVVFPNLSLTITPAAAAVINRIASEANAQPDKIVEVVAPPTKPSPGYDPGLAGSRIVVVEHALIAAGVPEKRLARRTLVVRSEAADPSGSQHFDLHLVLNQKQPVPSVHKHASAKGQHYIH